jgi:hypothetical protein
MSGERRVASSEDHRARCLVAARLLTRPYPASVLATRHSPLDP